MLSLQFPDAPQLIYNLTAQFPAQIWFVPSLMLMVLGIAAIIDARTGRVPLHTLNFAFLAGFLALTFYAGWLDALDRLGYALIPVLILLVVNKVCVLATRHDAFGMGDVHWSGVAALAFGPWPVFWAWVGGACSALVWLAFKKLYAQIKTALDKDTYQGHVYVHFVPFLMIGLCLALLFSLQAP